MYNKLFQEKNLIERTVIFVRGKFDIMLITTKKYKLKINDDLVACMNSYKQLNLKDKEAGGILIGYITNDNNIIIEYITKPFDKDIRKRFSFIRRDNKHEKILNSIWKNNGEVHTYVGEWHTHPEDYPIFSCIDKKNWINLGRNIKPSKTRYINIIVGNKELRVWEYNVINKKIERIK
ncbi:hypothetical protein C4D22_04760 [Clostridium perfringens]